MRYMSPVVPSPCVRRSSAAGSDSFGQPPQVQSLPNGPIPDTSLVQSPCRGRLRYGTAAVVTSRLCSHSAHENPVPVPKLNTRSSRYPQATSSNPTHGRRQIAYIAHISRMQVPSGCRNRCQKVVKRIAVSVDGNPTSAGSMASRGGGIFATSASGSARPR